MKGYALHACACSREEAHEIGRWRERWRFREVREERADPEAGELNGMDAGLGSLAPHFDEWIERQTEVKWPSSRRVPVAVPQPRRFEEVPEALPALPDSLLHAAGPRRVVVGAWSSPAPVHIQEAKISLLGLRRESRSTDSHDTQLVSLGDNQSEVLSEERGRAKDHGPNAICRRAAAIRLGCGVRWLRRYCDTGRNPSDADSRLADRGVLTPGTVLRGRSLAKAPSVSTDAPQDASSCKAAAPLCSPCAAKENLMPPTPTPTPLPPPPSQPPPSSSRSHADVAPAASQPSRNRPAVRTRGFLGLRTFVWCSD